MAYPMILPWLARKARVPIPVAEKIWDRSVADGDQRFTKGVRGSAYWRHVLRTFRDSLAAPGPLPTAVPAPDPAWETGFEFYLLQVQLLNRAWWAWASVLRRAFSRGPNLFCLWGLRA